MKLEHCNIEPSGTGSWINLGFSTISKCTPELLTEVGRRLELFLGHSQNAIAPYSPPLDNNILQAARELGIAGPFAGQTETVPTKENNVLAGVKPANRRARTPTPAAEPVVTGQAEAAPVTRRARTPASAAEPVITDVDLTKAASEAAAIVGVDVVKQIIAEMNVSSVNQIEGYKSREHFLGLLNLEMALAKEGSANAGA